MSVLFSTRPPVVPAPEVGSGGGPEGGGEGDATRRRREGGPSVPERHPSVSVEYFTNRDGDGRRGRPEGVAVRLPLRGIC